MQFDRNAAVSGALTDADTPPSRPGLKTVAGLVIVGLAIAGLVYATEIKMFFGITS